MNTQIAQRTDWPALLAAGTTELAREALSAATRRAYAASLEALHNWLDGRPVTDATLEQYVQHVADSGRTPSVAAMTLAAVARLAKVNRIENPAGPAVTEAMRAFRKRAAQAGLGHGQAAPMTVEGAAAIVATAKQPRKRGRGMETEATAVFRGTQDIAITGLLFHGGLRRSEAAALVWEDVTDAPNVEGAVLVRVRTSKANQTGDRPDVRLVKNGFAAAIRELRTEDVGPKDKVLGGLNGHSVGRRIRRAAKAAGLEGRFTGHSGRVGLATELTARGSATAEVMLAGGWTTSRMVAHYSAGARAERGAVARHL